MLDNEGHSRKPGYVSEGCHGYQPGLVVFHDGSIITNGSLHILWLSARICIKTNDSLDSSKLSATTGRPL
jgi:hypothetical protein